MTTSYPRNFLGYIDDKLPARLSGTYGEKFFGLPFSMGGDLWSEAARRVIRLHLVRHEYSPDDVLPRVAADRGLPKYPRESVAEWRARLADAWNIWSGAGTNQCIADQLTAAKYPGAHVYFDDTKPGPNGESAPYKTQFWLRFPSGSHHVTPGAPISDSDFQTWKFIAFAFSDVRYVPRGVILDTTEETFGAFAGDAFAGDAFSGDSSTSEAEYLF